MNTSNVSSASDFIQKFDLMQNLAIILTVSLAESRDNETGHRLKRFPSYVRVLAEKLKDNPRFVNFLTPQRIDNIVIASPIYDIGKVGLPDRVLLNPGRLTPEEFEIMKTHTTIGKNVIEKAIQITGADFEPLEIAKDMAYSHQEKWDGSGYPQGLSKDDIPFAGRLMAIADVYDALVSRRLYRPPISHSKTIEIIASESGRHFDPDIVEALLSVAGEFQAIYQSNPSTEADLIAYADKLATGFAEQVEIVDINDLGTVNRKG